MSPYSPQHTTVVQQCNQSLGKREVTSRWGHFAGNGVMGVLFGYTSDNSLQAQDIKKVKGSE